MENENRQKIGQQIFDKLRSKFENVTLGDAESQATQNPEDATFFNFDYIIHGENYGNVTISAIDDALKIYYSTNISDGLAGEELRDWYAFLQDFRKLAQSNMLTFDVHDINKSRLDINDIQTVASRNNEVIEGKMYGSSKSSYQEHGPTKIRVRHTENINPDVRGARSRKIESIFVETHEGERFKMPFNSLPGTRAMARHIGSGGRPYDLIGEAITTMVSETAALRPFIAQSRNKVFEDPTTSAMVEAAKEYYAETRNTLSKIKGKRGYSAFAENFVEVAECGEYNGDDMKGRFTNKRFNDRMEAAMPIVHKAYNLKEQPVMEANGDEFDDREWGDNAAGFGYDHPEDINNPFNNRDEDSMEWGNTGQGKSYGPQDFDKFNPDRIGPTDEFESWADGVVDNVKKTTMSGSMEDYNREQMGLSDDEMSLIGGILQGKIDLDDQPELYEKLFTYFLDSGEMPYGVAKARTGDPYSWILDELDSMFGANVPMEEGTGDYLSPGDHDPSRSPTDEEYNLAVNQLARATNSKLGSIGVNIQTGAINAQTEDGEEWEITGNKITSLGNEFPESVEEGQWDYSTKDKNKGAGWSAQGDGGAKNRKNRKAFRKAEKKRKHDAMMRGEDWAQEKVTEGTWAWPNSESDIEEIKGLFNAPIPFGVDGMDASNVVYNIIGDDELADYIYKQAIELGPDADARSAIAHWISANDMQLAHTLDLHGEYHNEYGTGEDGYEEMEEGIGDMNVNVQSFGNRGDDFKTDGRIVVKRDNHGKTFAFKNETDAKMYFGSSSWRKIKTNKAGYKVTFPKSMSESKATYSDYKKAYSSQDVSGTDSDSDAKAMVKHLKAKGKDANEKSAKAACKRMAEAKETDGLQVNESIKDIQKLAGILNG